MQKYLDTYVAFIQKKQIIAIRLTLPTKIIDYKNITKTICNKAK